MCYFRYTYYSRCQHAEFNQYSYCDRAKALGLPHRDNRYRRGIDADFTAVDFPASSLQVPLPNPVSSSTLPTQRPTVQYHIMSTLSPAAAASALHWAEFQDEGESLSQADHVPRSVRNGSMSPTHTLESNASLNSPPHCDTDPDVLLNAQSILSMELSHDGKVLGLVARFGQWQGLESSQLPQEIESSRTRASSAATVRPSELQTERLEEFPTRSSPKEATIHESCAEEESRSPRKPIPSHWVTTPPRAPVLRTMMRQEQREQKKTTQGNSPTTLRSSKSSVELNRTPVSKEQSDVSKRSGVPLSTPSSPTKMPRMKSQTSLRSPVRGQTQDKACHSPSVQSVVSPIRSTGLAVKEPGRAPSSILSTGDTEFCSARYSPVSSAASRAVSTNCSPSSFITANEQDEDIPHLDLAGANLYEQQGTVHGKLPPSAIPRSKPTVSGTLPIAAEKKSANRSTNAPKLKLRTSKLDMSSGPKTSSSSDSPESSKSGTLPSPSRSTRAPRGPSSATLATRASTLKAKQATKTLTPAKSKTQLPRTSIPIRVQPVAVVEDSASVEPCLVPLPTTPATTPQKHVVTLNSSGATPIIDNATVVDSEPLPGEIVHSTSRSETIKVKADEEDDSCTAVGVFEKLEAKKPRSLMESVAKILKREANTEPFADKSASITNDQRLQDPFLQDPAIVSSRKRSDAGMTRQSLSLANHIVTLMKTHPDLEVGASEFLERWVEEHANSTDGMQSSSSFKQDIGSDNETSSNILRPSRSSELRATAPEFVPASADQRNNDWQFSHDPFSVGMYGMPWVYHMYPVPMAAPFAKSPKKGKSHARVRNRSPKKREQMQEPEQETSKANAAFASQLEEIALNAPARKDRGFQHGPVTVSQMMAARGGRTFRNVGNGLYDTRGRGAGRPAGLPIDATAPFPDPVPPSGRKGQREYFMVRGQEGCGVVDVEVAAERVHGPACNTCEPDH